MVEAGVRGWPIREFVLQPARDMSPTARTSHPGIRHSLRRSEAGVRLGYAFRVGNAGVVEHGLDSADVLFVDCADQELLCSRRCDVEDSPGFGVVATFPVVDDRPRRHVINTQPLRENEHHSRVLLAFDTVHGGEGHGGPGAGGDNAVPH